MADDDLDFLDKIADLIQTLGTSASLLACGIFFVIDAFYLLFAIFEWLQTAEWPGWSWISLYDALHYFEIDTYTLHHPETWKGLAKVVLWILAAPVSLSIAIIGTWLSFKIRSIIRH